MLNLTILIIINYNFGKFQEVRLPELYLKKNKHPIFKITKQICLIICLYLSIIGSIQKKKLRSYKKCINSL